MNTLWALLALIGASAVVGDVPVASAAAPSPGASLATAPADVSPAQAAEIARLIEQLGSAEFEQREAASRKLIEFGELALPALRRALTHADAEVSHRARLAIRDIEHMPPERRAELRRQVQAAFARGDYEAAAANYGVLARRSRAAVEDCLWAGHCWRLAEDWPRAVAAYQRAIDRLDAMIAGEAPEGDEPADDANAPGGPMERPGPVKLRGAPMDDAQRAVLIRQRAAILVLIGRIQLDLLEDAKSAAGSLTRALDHTPEAKLPAAELADRLRREIEEDRAAAAANRPARSLPQLYQEWQAMEELARAQERLGCPRDAVQTLGAMHLTMRRGGREPSHQSLAALGALLQKLPADQPAPPALGLIVPPSQEAFTLDLNDAGTLAKAMVCYQFGRGRVDFAVAAPPGQELAALHVDCDAIMINPHHAMQVEVIALAGGSPSTDISLGMMNWPQGAKPGKHHCTKRFDIPAGAAAAILRVSHGKESFQVDRVDVKAELRPRVPAQPAPVNPVVWVQTDALPAGGQLTVDGKPLGVRVATTSIAPGKHLLAYQAPGHPRSWQVQADLVAGRRYGLFVNLDSPFEGALTNLHSPSRSSSDTRAVVRLPDQRWLLAYSDGPKLMFTTSRDGIDWDQPWPYPRNQVSTQAEPAMVVDDQGVIWMAHFADGLSLDPGNTPGYLLWLSSSRDGKNWSRPRPVLGRSVDATPQGPAHLLRGHDGVFWLFYGKSAASAKSPGDLTQLQPLEMKLGEGASPMHPQVVLDDQGRMHMVFDTGDGQCHYAQSADGRNWSDPAPLAMADRAGMPSHPQLVIAGDRAAVIYQTHQGSFLARARLADLPKIGPSVKVADHVAPLRGWPVLCGADGQVHAFAGTDTAWRLQAKLSEVVGQPGR